MVRINEDLRLWSGGNVSGVPGSVTAVHAYVPDKGVPLVSTLVLFLGSWLGRGSAKVSVKTGEGGIFCGVFARVYLYRRGTKNWAIFNKYSPLLYD